MSSTTSAPTPQDDSTSYGVFGVLVMLDVFFVSNYYIIKSLRTYRDAYTASLPQDKDFGSEAKESGAAGGFFEKIILGLCLGKIRAVPLSVQKFPGWKPIPFKMGLIFTSIFVLIALIVLNPAMFTPEDTEVGGLTLSGEFCSDFDRQTGLDLLKENVLSLTNFDQAVAQHAHMADFKTALLADVTLYGEAGFGCPVILATDTSEGLTGFKAEWSSLTKYPASEFGSFFPGYCQSAREIAMQVALSTTCTQEKCACPRLPSTGLTKFFGVDGDEVCMMRVCLSSPNACPAHTDDYLGNSNNYREAQLEETDAPDPTIGELQAQGKEIATDAAMAGLQLFLYQVDLASNFYAIYSVVALYFPTPLVVFRLPYTIAIKRFLFGADQNKFIILFVSLLWIFEYARSFIVSPDFQLFINNLVAGDPCFLDGVYVYERYDVINQICDQLVPLKPDFDFSNTAVQQILPEIEFFAADKCDCAFPMQNLHAFNDELFPLTEVEDLGFDENSLSKYGESFCQKKGGCTVYLPNTEIVFIGNRTLCLDAEETRKLAVEPADSEVNWNQFQEMWFDTGLLATFFVKISMTNFALGLARLADPFVTCAGEFLWIPAKLGTGLGGRDKNTVFRGFMKNKLGTLRNVNLRSVVVWGTIMHLCLYNIFKSTFTAQPDGVFLTETDQTLLTFTGVCSLVVIVFTVCLNCLMKARGRRLRRRAGKGESDEQDADDASDDDDASYEE